jgi:GGDEF domain-containing protein
MPTQRAAFTTGGDSRLITAIIKRTTMFIVPAAVLIATWFLIPRIAGLPPARQELVVFAPYVMTLLGMFLAVHFHRGRPFTALLLLVLFYWGSCTYLVGEELEPALDKVYQGFILLIPLNMLLLTLMRERGIISTAGRLRFAFLSLQTAGVVWLFRHHFSEFLPYIARNYSNLPLLERILIPQPALLAAVLCLAAIALLALRRQAPVDSSMLGALFAFLIAANWVTNRDIHAAYCTAGALIMTLGVLRDSYNMAFRDDLTGIPSRRSLNESLQGIGRRYTIAMLDVDHFKRFNDTYGHDVGDQVLKMVARKMMDVGGGGKAYRYGGEEFTILFPGRRTEDVLPHLEELRRTIAGYRLALRGDERPKGQRQGKDRRGTRSVCGEGAFASVTVSIGVAANGDGSSAAEVMKAADKALYKAKNKGRNQICR